VPCKLGPSLASGLPDCPPPSVPFPICFFSWCSFGGFAGCVFPKTPNPPVSFFFPTHKWLGTLRFLVRPPRSGGNPLFLFFPFVLALFSFSLPPQSLMAEAGGDFSVSPQKRHCYIFRKSLCIFLHDLLLPPFEHLCVDVDFADPSKICSPFAPSWHPKFPLAIVPRRLPFPLLRKPKMFPAFPGTLELAPSPLNVLGCEFSFFTSFHLIFRFYPLVCGFSFGVLRPAGPRPLFFV